MQTAEAKQDAPVPTSAIAKKERAPLGFMARDLDELWRVSDMLSKAAIIPDALRDKPFDVQVILMTGHDLGLTFMQSIREVYVVKGKGFLSTALKVGLILQSGLCEYWNDITPPDRKNVECIIETKRKGSPSKVTHKFTEADAKAADLFKNNIWNQYKPVMLAKRCASQLADMVYPDVVRGMATSDDEMLFETEVKGEAVRVSATTAPPTPVVTTKAPATKTAPAVVKTAPAQPMSEAVLEVPEGFDPISGVEKEPAPQAQAEPAKPFPAGPREPGTVVLGLAGVPVPAKQLAENDELEMEIHSLGQAIDSAKSREELKGLVDRLKALPTKDQTELRVRYTAQSRKLPA